MIHPSKKTFLTQEGLKELQEQLRVLKEVKRVEVADKLKEAISYGDLSENSEYEEARNEQAQVELKILDLEELLKNTEIIDDKQAKKKIVVVIGSTVTISSGKGTKGEKLVYKIVGSTESNILENKISNESPVGKALMGKGVHDVVRGKVGAGTFEYEILEIA
jgi:transcription elongation factor GreA